VQTPLEIIAKKLKHREKATIRDFVDYAIAEDKSQLLTKLKSEGIVDIERYFDVIDKFNNFDEALFNEELKNLLPNQALTKDELSDTINEMMKPTAEYIKVALDNTNEVVAFDEFIEISSNH
jgi:nucleoid DNA-binding protein